jgi:hypothetical protein
MRVPARSQAVGIPATIKENRSDPVSIEFMATVYIDNAAH